jgi:hypothetical protein
MLTVQTQSHEHMLRITAQDSQCRLLGAMEATQSSVVDVENIDALMPYEITHVQSVPTLSLLDSVAFDNVTEEWSFTYETMALDTGVHGQINSYYRVLYLTRTEHNVGASDTANMCLQPGMVMMMPFICSVRNKKRLCIVFAVSALGLCCALG